MITQFTIKEPLDPALAFGSGGLRLDSAGSAASAPTNTSYKTTNTAGSTSYASAPPPPPDPYAQWGGRDKYNALVSGFNTQKSNIIGSADSAALQGQRDQKASILDFIDSYRTGQNKVNLASVNNEVAMRQGRSGIVGMVGRGIRSGGVMLANKNAGDSSAAGAIARAYGELGQREMRGVGNQYESKKGEIGLQQQDLVDQARNYQRDYEDEKIRTVNRITNEARNKLAALDADMLNAELPDRIAIEQEKSRVKSRALAKLSHYDNYLKTQKARVRPITDQERRSRAIAAQMAGRDLGEGAFDFTEEAPPEWEEGPETSDLPIFTRPREEE